MKGGALAHHAPFVQKVEGRARDEPLRQTSREPVERPAGAERADDSHALPEPDTPAPGGLQHRIGKIHAPDAGRHDLAVVYPVRMSQPEGPGKLETGNHRGDGVDRGRSGRRKTRRVLEVAHALPPVPLRGKNSYLYKK